jgi:hypothetical protein
MSQIRLTKQERIQALERLGYTDREAAFLSLAALNGGYFLRRQYCQFLNKAVGGTAASLIEKVLTKGHAHVATYGNNIRVYHLAARPFYAALGQEDNRNRRLRQPETIKDKLLGLDFVLAHRDQEYLTTEQEKLDYFVATLGLTKAVLPGKCYVGSGKTTERYLVEKFPIFLSGPPQAASSPVVSFCFVDGSAASVSGFWTFLQQYGRLFAALRRFHVVYVADIAIRFEAAEAAFGRFIAGRMQAESMAPGDPLVRRMLAHFEARNHYEAQQWSTFDRDKLIRLRNERREFSGDPHEALYRLWKSGGAMAVDTVLAATRGPTIPSEGSFSIYRVEHPYDFFGALRTGN